MGFLSKVFKPIGKLVGAIFKPLTKLLQSWLAPDLPDKQGLKLQRVGSNHPIPVVYGTRIVGGMVVDKNVTDGELDFSVFGIPFTIKDGNKNGLLHLLVVFCYGEVDAIEEIYFNGTPSGDEQFKKDGRNMFGIDYRLGGADNDTPVDGVGKFNKFDVQTSKYEGLCYALITVEQDKDQSVWRGEPEITAKIRGKKCYDWRSDTVLYTENPAVHMVDYVKSDVYGISLDDSDINYPYFTQVADFCDQEEEGNTVTTATGYYDYELREYVETGSVTTTETFKRFTNNNIIDTDKELFENMKELAQPFRGYFPEPDGRLAIASEDSASPVFNFNGDNIVSTITRTQAAANERFNRVVVRFPNRLNKFEFDEVYYPEESDPIYSEWLEADNYLQLENTIEIEHCVYKAEALQLAEVAAKASRNAEQVQFTATFEAVELDVGDVIAISDETRGWIDREYRIVSLEYRDDALVDITAILHNNTIYPWVTKDYEERVGGVFLGDPYNPSAPFNLTLTPDPTLTTTGTLTWSYNDDAFVRRYRVVINRDGDSVLDINTQSRSYVVPTLDAGTYEIDVYAISTTNSQSDEASLALVLTAPVAPDAMVFNTTDWTIEVQPTISSGGVGFGTTFEFDYVFGDGAGHTPTVRFDGASLVATGLIPATQYTFFARARNAYGASEWFSASATTTNTGAQINAQLDPIRDELDEVQLAIDNLPEDFGDFSKLVSEIDGIQDDITTDIHSYMDEITGLHENWKAREIIRNNEVQQELEIREFRAEFDEVSSAFVSQITGVRADVEGNAEAISSIEGEVSSVQGNVSAAFVQINALEVTAEGNAEAITLLGNEVTTLTGDVAANTNLLLASELDADGNTKATVALETRVSSVESESAASTSLIQQSGLDAQGNTDATVALTTRVDSVESGVDANTLLLQQSGLTVDGDTLATVAIKAEVNDPGTGLIATNTLAQQAKSTADGNVTAISGLESRVESNEDFASAQLILNSGFNSELNSLAARAFLGVNVNDRVTGITIADSGSQQQILFQSDAVGFTDNAGTLKIYYDTVAGRYVFNGEIVANAGTFSGTVSSANISASDITGGTITGATVTGGTLRTAASGSRTIIQDDGTYLFWAGNGAKNDSNATFFIKKDGTGFIKGSFFSGQIIEANQASGTTSASLSHDSAGKDVQITVFSSGSSTTIASNAPGPVGATTYTRTVTVKRGTTTLKTIPAIITRVIEYEPAESEYTTRDFYNFSTDFVDTGTSSANYTYSVTIGAMPLSGASQEITIKTFENILD